MMVFQGKKETKRLKTKGYADGQNWTILKWIALN